MNRNQMDIMACAAPDTVLEGAKTPGWMKRMRESHIRGFFVTAYDVSEEIDPEKLSEVKRILGEEGFEVFGIGLPVGHPAGLDTPRYTFHEGWHIRRDIEGRETPWQNAVTPRLIEDARKRVLILKEIGFPAMFWDDDLRMGNHEGDVQGCFCEACLEDFRESRPELAPRIGSREDLRPVLKKDPRGLSEEALTLREAWMDFTSSRVTAFMRETAVEGVKNGIMVMHNGDRRHGIDIPAIRKAVPDCLFRVGELMFDDKSFEKPENRRSLAESVLRHMALMGDPDRIWSESTVYPHGALSPENLRRKIVLERKCGLFHINLMGVERMNSPAYYKMLRESYGEFLETGPSLTLENLDRFDFGAL